MKDVRISNAEKWQALHWKTLTSAYRRSPWFEYFEHELEDLYGRQFGFLMDWNMACLEWANSALGVSREICFTDTYQKTYEPADGVTDKRGFWVPGKPKEGVPEYTQVFATRTGFIPDLSILDLIFCEGKRGLSLLK